MGASEWLMADEREPDELEPADHFVLAAAKTAKQYPEYVHAEHRDWLLWHLARIAREGKSERHRLRALEALADRADPLPRNAPSSADVLVGISIALNAASGADARAGVPSGGLTIHLTRDGGEQQPQ